MKEEILTSEEIKQIRKIWLQKRHLKIELEDLLQEARLLKWRKEDIFEGLRRYCRNWSEEPLSYSQMLPPNLSIDFEEEEEKIKFPKGLLEYLKGILTPRQFEVFYKVKVENLSPIQVSQELGLKPRIIYQHLQNAEEKIVKKREEIKALISDSSE